MDDRIASDQDYIVRNSVVEQHVVVAMGPMNDTVTKQTSAYLVDSDTNSPNTSSNRVGKT